MKKSLLIIFLLSFNYTVFAQLTKEDVFGSYTLKSESSNATLIDTLSLHLDGNFTFHEYDKHDKGIPPERNTYAKGTWHVVKNLIYFTTSQSDFDDKHTLDFNNTKARFIRKSPRDQSNRAIKTALRFYESEIFWITSRTLFKLE